MTGVADSVTGAWKNEAGESRRVQVEELREERLDELFGYWQRLGRPVPFFLPVRQATWAEALLAEPRGMNGLHLVPGTGEVAVAVADGRICGLVQYGIPNVAWDEQGELVEQPHDVAVIRHLYFDPGLPEAGKVLLGRALGALAGKRRIHAFFHAHGMSCNGCHGKLHESFSHVADLLLDQGFAVEHENVYYTLDMATVGLPAEEGQAAQRAADPGAGVPESHAGTGVIALRVNVEQRPHGPSHSVIALLDGEEIGNAEFRPLGDATGGAAADTAYLSWIGIRKERQGQGLGRRFLEALIAYLRSEGFRHLHLDTAHDNLRAQGLYHRCGFTNHGVTRSFVRQGA